MPVSETGQPPTPTIEPATPEDVPAVAEVFARAFGDYRRAFGCDSPTLARLWTPLIAARLPSWLVARTPPSSPQEDPLVVGILSLEEDGARESRGADCGRWQSGFARSASGGCSGLSTPCFRSASRTFVGRPAMTSCTCLFWP